MHDRMKLASNGAGKVTELTGQPDEATAAPFTFVVGETAGKQGAISVSLVWGDQRDTERPDAPHILVTSRFGDLRVKPEQADALVQAVEKVGGPDTLVDDLAVAAAIIAPYQPAGGAA